MNNDTWLDPPPTTPSTSDGETVEVLGERFIVTVGRNTPPFERWLVASIQPGRDMEDHVVLVSDCLDGYSRFVAALGVITTFLVGKELEDGALFVDHREIYQRAHDELVDQLTSERK